MAGGVRQAPVAWGEAVNGLQAGLSVENVTAGPESEATLAFHLRNAGDRPVRFLVLRSRKYFWGDHLPLQVRFGGKELAYKGPVLEPPQAPSTGAYIFLAPGKTDLVRAVMRAKHWGLKTLQGVEIAFAFRNTLKTDSAADGEVDGLWTGQARSGAIPLDRALLEAFALAGPALTAEPGKVIVAYKVPALLEAIRTRLGPEATKRQAATWLGDLIRERVGGWSQWAADYAKTGRLVVDP